jgi:hypothetical protein
MPISMPITVIAVLSFSDMACSLSLVPLASVTCWRGGSTAGPFHYQKSQDLADIICIHINTGNTSATPASAADALRELAAAT